MKKVYYLIFFSIIFFSCKNNVEVKSGGGYVINLNRDLLNNDLKFSDIFSKAKFILLDTTFNAFFGSISSMKKVNDTLYIFDRAQTKAVFKFGTDGKFIGKIGNIGKGPGEYLNPCDFDVNIQNGDVSILDWSSKNILTFDHNGDYKSSLRFKKKFTSFSKVNDLTYCAKSYSNNELDNIFYCLNKKGEILYSHFLASTYQETNNKIIFRFGNPIYKTAKDLKYVLSNCDTIFSVGNNSISPFLTFNISSKITNRLNNSGLQLHAYSQNEEMLFFKIIIDNVPYDVFYSFKNGKTAIFNYVKLSDDLTNIPCDLLGIYGDIAIGQVPANNLHYINSLIKSGKIDNPMIIEFVRNQGNSNLFVYYEFQKTNNWDN